MVQLLSSCWSASLSPLPSAPWHLGPDQREHFVFANLGKAHTPTQECLHTWGLAHMHRTGQGGLSAQADPLDPAGQVTLPFLVSSPELTLFSHEAFLSFPKTHSALLLGRNPSKITCPTAQLPRPTPQQVKLFTSLCPCESCSMSRSHFFQSVDSRLPSDFCIRPHDITTVCVIFLGVTEAQSPIWQLCHAVLRHCLFMENACCF